MCTRSASLTTKQKHLPLYLHDLDVMYLPIQHYKYMIVRHMNHVFRFKLQNIAHSHPFYDKKILKIGQI